MTYGQYPDLIKVKKILVVKLRQLGDVLLTAPVFQVLKNHLPNCDIDAYIYSEAFPMLEGHPAVHRLIGYDRGWKKWGLWARFQKEWALWKEIRSSKYDMVINLTEGDRGAFAARISGASIRVGFEPKGRFQKQIYTHTIKHCPTLRHTVERNLDALRRIGVFPSFEERELFLHVPEEAQRKVPQQPFILIHPTSRWRFKCWPIDKMRQLTEELLSRGKKLVFTSGPDPIEQQMIQQIVKGLDVINLSAQLTLKELAACILASELLICVDSVPFHMASALKKKVIALFGPTSDITWGPWRNPQAQVIAKKMSCRPCYLDGCGGSKMSDCLATLGVDEVLQAVATSENPRRDRFCVLADR